MTLVTQESGRRGLHGYLDEDGVYMVARGVAGEPYAVDLEHLAQRCQQAQPDDWAEVVRYHFSALEEIQQHTQERDAQSKDFTQVRASLKVRLYPEALRAQGLPLVCRPVAPGLIAALVHDFPTSVAAVTPEERAGWSLSDEALFQIGLGNVVAQDRPDIDSFPLADGATATVLSGDSLFITTYLLCIEQHFDQVPPYGWLVAVPQQHTLLAFPIDDGRAVASLASLLQMIRTLYESGPGSLSPDLYWKKGDELMALPCEWEGSTVRFAPDMRFIEQVLIPLKATRDGH